MQDMSKPKNDLRQSISGMRQNRRSRPTRMHPLQDMAKPESSRLRRNMSALVNLAKFREEKLIDYVEGQKTAEELQQKIWELEDQKKGLVRYALLDSLRKFRRASDCISCSPV